MRSFPERPAAPLSRHLFVLLRDLINARAGLYYEDDKLDLFADKLVDRVIERGFAGFQEYYHHLKYDPDGEAEWTAIYDALTVNETYFMREVDQLHACVDIVVPELIAQHRAPLTIWSAACASGEEPLSLAMLLLERGLEGEVRIVATDISRRALERARRGRYGARSLRAMPPQLAERYLERDGAEWDVRQSVRDLVSFRNLNLLDPVAMRAIRGIDVIFCRNVFIYFASASIQTVLDHFAAALNPGGYLFVGAAESLLRHASPFELVEIGGAFTYRKRDVGRG